MSERDKSEVVSHRVTSSMVPLPSLSKVWKQTKRKGGIVLVVAVLKLTRKSSSLTHSYSRLGSE